MRCRLPCRLPPKCKRRCQRSLRYSKSSPRVTSTPAITSQKRTVQGQGQGQDQVVEVVVVNNLLMREQEQVLVVVEGVETLVRAQWTFLNGAQGACALGKGAVLHEPE